jgi:hypothetical protein
MQKAERGHSKDNSGVRWNEASWWMFKRRNPREVPRGLENRQARYEARCTAAFSDSACRTWVKTGGYRTATLMTGSPSINGHTGRFLTALPTDGAFSRYAAATLAPSKGRLAASSSRAT